MTEDDLRSWYWRYVEALNNHELDGMDKFINDEVLLDGVPGSRHDVVSALKGIFDAVPDFHWDVKELLIDRDRIAIRAINAGTPVKEWLGVPATGRSFEIAEHVIYTVSDGRFVKMTNLHDSAALRQQLTA
ncbi:ester cyclase [Nonomuraea angiospora]|uniref:ester cyclase n=1 Tax=Nonomuraea TaxID=83681 RepID=UPI0033A5E695